MRGEVSVQQVLRLISDAGDGPATDFAVAVQTELEAMPPATTLGVVWGAMQPSLKVIYWVRRGHLAERGADVGGLDAFLRAIEQSPEGTDIGFIVVKSPKANLVAMCDREVRTLIGWAIVPLDLPSLEEARAVGLRELRDGTVTLYRPVGQTEMDLIADAGYRAFPPRLEWQPIFYPVLNEDYAMQIARDWNTKDQASGYVGYVTRFQVRAVFASRYEPQQVGGRNHVELWVPADELDEFNANIVGAIEVIAEFRRVPDATM
jgi:hypothetical protein